MDVFHEPGNCDLTANVDFAYLKEAMNDLGMLVKFSLYSIISIQEITIVTTSGPISQGVFLEKMGISVRLQTLTQAARSEKRRGEIHRDVMRLTSPSGMGKEYKVMGITNNSKDMMVWPFYGWRA